jgi:hypothetical protein
MQWIGHHVEGNDMGELILFKKCLGLPYQEVSPRYQRDHQNPGRSSRNSLPENSSSDHPNG